MPGCHRGLLSGRRWAESRSAQPVVRERGRSGQRPRRRRPCRADAPLGASARVRRARRTEAEEPHQFDRRGGARTPTAYRLGCSEIAGSWLSPRGSRVSACPPTTQPGLTGYHPEQQPLPDMPHVMREKEAPREPKGRGVPGQPQPARDGLASVAIRRAGTEGSAAEEAKHGEDGRQEGKPR